MYRRETPGATVWVGYQSGLATVDEAADGIVRLLILIIHLVARQNIGCSSSVPIMHTQPPAGLLVWHVYSVLTRLQHTSPRMQAKGREQGSSFDPKAGEADTKAFRLRYTQVRAAP
jgi:hypothetical protein